MNETNTPREPLYKIVLSDGSTCLISMDIISFFKLYCTNQTAMATRALMAASGRTLRDCKDIIDFVAALATMPHIESKPDKPFEQLASRIVYLND